MITRHSLPPPVHVHVPETTPVHVHMRRSPDKTTQAKDVRGVGGRPKIRTPWIPPGRPSSRRDMMDSYKPQTSRIQHAADGGTRHQQEDEPARASEGLSFLLREQENIRRSKKPDSGGQHNDTDMLLRALVEAEIDGMAVANQLTALKETIDSLSKEKRLSKLHSASLGRQQELLLEKIEMFENTNRSLRDLLREWSEYEREWLVWSVENEALRKKLADRETQNIRLFAKLTNKQKEASKLAEHLDFEKDNVKTTEELSRVLKSTRSHLESQLDRAEAQNTQLTAQIQEMQQSHEQKQEELCALQEELQTLRQQREEKQQKQEQEELAVVAQRAQRAEESARQLMQKLQEKEAQLSRALSTSSDWCLRHSKEAAAKGQLEQEASALQMKMTELSAQLHLVEEKSRTEREELRDQILQLSAENASIKLDNQRLRSELTSSEEKFRGFHAEARHLKSSILKYENLVEKYKKKVHQARLDSEECYLKLEMTQKETREVKESLEKEKEQVRQELLVRLRELELLPEKLRRTEQQLREAQQEAEVYERRNTEHSAALSEVRLKVEQLGAQMETSQQRNLLLQEENGILKEKMTKLERKLDNVTAENKEMSQALVSKDGLTCSLQQQLEEKTRECSILSRQLKQTLDDAQRQVDDSLQKLLTKERASQSKALELQSQLSRANTDLSQLQRSKEEMERRFKTQLQNLKERLEQSDSTNRSLQNYVHFLKTSYGNVFGDSFIGS